MNSNQSKSYVAGNKMELESLKKYLIPYVITSGILMIGLNAIPALALAGSLIIMYHYRKEIKELIKKYAKRKTEKDQLLLPGLSQGKMVRDRLSYHLKFLGLSLYL